MSETRWYTVEVRGESRELYTVEAESADDAMANWVDGQCELTEVTSPEPVRAWIDD